MSLEAMSQREKACFVSFDIEGAFDRVWHNGLIYKLVKLELPFYLLKWVEYFLKDRRLCVKVNKYKTAHYAISNGVPQGAVLSPLLFSIFINDVPLFNRPPSSYSVLFADDLGNLFLFNKINKEVESQINIQIEKLINWTLYWLTTQMSWALDSISI